jgi:TolB protein
MEEEVMKTNEILSVFILIYFILWTFLGYKESAVEPDPEDDHYMGQIAFSSDREGNYEVYRMNGDGNNQINLTNSEAMDVDPVFSP